MPGTALLPKKPALPLPWKVVLAPRQLAHRQATTFPRTALLPRKPALTLPRKVAVVPRQLDIHPGLGPITLPRETTLFPR